MLNLKLGLETPLDIRVTTVEDLVAATRKLTDLKRGKSNEEKAREGPSVLQRLATEVNPSEPILLDCELCMWRGARHRQIGGVGSNV